MGKRLGHMLEDCKLQGSEKGKVNDKRVTKGRSRRSWVDAYGSGKRRSKEARAEEEEKMEVQF